jgi:hypothetical protein
MGYIAPMAPHPFNWQPAFLAALRAMPIIRHACLAVGIARSTAWRAREADKDFAAAWDDAMADGVDAAEQAAFRRGVEGFEEPVIDKGRLAYRYERYEDEMGMEAWRMVLDDKGQPVPLTVRKHSDAMLALILKGRRKEVYADRTELAGVEGQPLMVDPTARAARVAQLLALAQQRKDFSDLA